MLPYAPLMASAGHDPEIYARAKRYVQSQLSKPEELRTKAPARLAEQRKALRDLDAQLSAAMQAQLDERRRAMELI